VEATAIKNCSACGLDKPINDFRTINSLTRDRKYLSSKCRGCETEYTANWKSKNTKKHLNQLFRYRQKNSETFKLGMSRWYYSKAERLNSEKIKSIKKIGCICPGCGFDYSSCPDRALMLIFEKSHVHSSTCSLRKQKKNNRFNIVDDFFWSCQYCNNGVQRNKCGSWESPNNFKSIC
jgi:hypothetical protein